jgi:hypothetical protein
MITTVIDLAYEILFFLLNRTPMTAIIVLSIDTHVVDQSIMTGTLESKNSSEIHNEVSNVRWFMPEWPIRVCNRYMKRTKNVINPICERIQARSKYQPQLIVRGFAWANVRIENLLAINPMTVSSRMTANVHCIVGVWCLSDWPKRTFFYREVHREWSYICSMWVGNIHRNNNVDKHKQREIEPILVLIDSIDHYWDRHACSYDNCFPNDWNRDNRYWLEHHTEKYFFHRRNIEYQRIDTD